MTTIRHSPMPWRANPLVGGIFDAKDQPLLQRRGATVQDMQIAAAGPAMYNALCKAERFIAGFEDDPLQEGIGELLEAIRSACRAAQGIRS
jgi:hypothetical protein